VSLWQIDHTVHCTRHERVSSGCALDILSLFRGTIYGRRDEVEWRRKTTNLSLSNDIKIVSVDWDSFTPNFIPIGGEVECWGTKLKILPNTQSRNMNKASQRISCVIFTRFSWFVGRSIMFG